jgi:tetrahydromethanopterin S-methyltransferase subunit G
MAYTNPDAIEVSEMLDAVSTRLPEMITNLLKTVYSEEAGRNVGRAVGTLYQELVEAGIPKDLAVKMASDYMISFKDVLGSFTNRDGSVITMTKTGDGGPPKAPEAPETGDSSAQ